MTELATKTCKIDGCTNAASSTHGRYAGLCSEHRDQKRQSNGATADATSGKFHPTMRLLAAADAVADATYECENAKVKLAAAVAELQTILTGLAD